MKVGYGGAMILPLYPCDSCNQELYDSISENQCLNFQRKFKEKEYLVKRPMTVQQSWIDFQRKFDNKINSLRRFKATKHPDYIKVIFQPEYIDQFIKMWEEDRLPQGKNDSTDLLRKIMEHSYFACNLDKNGYFEAFFVIISEDVYNRYKNEILSNEAKKEGFRSEISTHFTDLFAFVHSQLHTHTYPEDLREILHHFTLLGVSGSIAYKVNYRYFNKPPKGLRTQVYSKINSNISDNFFREKMYEMDEVEHKILRMNFINFVKNLKTVLGEDYKYFSESAHNLRQAIWSLNYIEANISTDHASLSSVNELSHNLRSFARLLISRKDVAETIKNTLSYFVGLTSTVLAFYMVIVAIILTKYPDIVTFSGILIFTFFLAMVLLYKLYDSIKCECKKEDSSID